MKKMVVLLLVACMVLSTSGCGKEKNYTMDNVFNQLEDDAKKESSKWVDDIHNRYGRFE